MSLPLYLLRHSVLTVSSALYSPENSDRSVQMVESPSGNQISSHHAVVIQGGKKEHPNNGEPMTYTQLLELLLTADKVVTL